MTYSEIRSTIKATAEALLAENGGVGLFHYGRESQHPIEGYTQPTPQIWVDPFTDDTNYSTGLMMVPVTIGFFDQDVQSSNAEQQTAMVDAMKELSKEYMLRLSENEMFEEISAKTTPVYRYTQAMLTGVAVSFTLRTNAVLC